MAIDEIDAAQACSFHVAARHRARLTLGFETMRGARSYSWPRHTPNGWAKPTVGTRACLTHNIALGCFPWQLRFLPFRPRSAEQSMSRLDWYLIQIYAHVKGEPQEQYVGPAHSNHCIRHSPFWICPINEEPQLHYVELEQPEHGIWSFTF